MSLYYESAAFLARPNEQSSLKSLVFSGKSLKSNPVQCYALIVETVKWSSVLSNIIDNSKLLRDEQKLTPELALLLAHDLVLSKNGVAAPKHHILRQSIERHKSRLTAEFTRARVKAGFATVNDWRKAQDADADSLPEASNGENSSWRHPRWIRINTLKSTLDAELQHIFADFEHLQDLRDVLQAPPTTKVLVKDEHIQDLVAVPHGIDLTKNPAYLNGRIIFQDKASCFPAVLLDLQPADGDILDACAAPGNKTTHLAALASGLYSTLNSPHRLMRIFACERDKGRAATLQKMINTAVGTAQLSCQIECLPGRDFLKLDPNEAKFSNVGAIVLDPSCSGSGMVGRDDTSLVPGYELILPRSSNQIHDDDQRSRKRKRPSSHARADAVKADSHVTIQPVNGGIEEEANDEISKQYSGRLKALSDFQSSIIEHAFRFQSAHKVVYSTCSIHAEENEQVVIRALLSSPARERGWRICTRSEQTPALRQWHRRGDVAAIDTFVSNSMQANVGKLDAKTITDACIRCEKGTEDGTMGFFAVLFIRDKADGQTAGPTTVSGGSSRTPSNAEQEEEEWNGFSEDDYDDAY